MDLLKILGVADILLIAVFQAIALFSWITYMMFYLEPQEIDRIYEYPKSHKSGYPLFNLLYFRFYAGGISDSIMPRSINVDLFSLKVEMYGSKWQIYLSYWLLINHHFVLARPLKDEFDDDGELIKKRHRHFEITLSLKGIANGLLELLISKDCKSGGEINKTYSLKPLLSFFFNYAYCKASVIEVSRVNKGGRTAFVVTSSVFWTEFLARKRKMYISQVFICDEKNADIDEEDVHESIDEHYLPESFRVGLIRSVGDPFWAIGKSVQVQLEELMLGDVFFYESIAMCILSEDKEAIQNAHTSTVDMARELKLNNDYIF